MVHLVHFSTNNVLNKFGLQNCSVQFWKLYREEFKPYREDFKEIYCM